MTQIERTIDVTTGKITEREMTQSEIAELATTKSVAEMQLSNEA
jgi:hypothetical protein